MEGGGCGGEDPQRFRTFLPSGGAGQARNMLLSAVAEGTPHLPTRKV